jgi:AAA ATPase-like protein
VAIPATSVFVGRQSELRALHDAFGAASDGHSQLLLVEGEAGIGKTTLVERFVAELETARVLLASGDESESHVPFAIADQLLRYDRCPADHVHPSPPAVRRPTGHSLATGSGLRAREKP